MSVPPPYVESVRAPALSVGGVVSQLYGAVLALLIGGYGAVQLATGSPLRGGALVAVAAVLVWRQVAVGTRRRGGSTLRRRLRTRITLDDDGVLVELVRDAGPGWVRLAWADVVAVVASPQPVPQLGTTWLYVQFLTTDPARVQQGPGGETLRGVDGSVVWLVAGSGGVAVDRFLDALQERRPGLRVVDSRRHRAG